MKEEFNNKPLSLTQKLLRESIIVIIAIFLTSKVFNAINEFERLKQQEALTGDCLVLKISKDNGKVFYVAGIYRGGSETDLSSYDIRDTFLVPEKAFQFRVNENDATMHDKFVKAYIAKDRVELIFPDIVP
ncbi:MAG: hypothetical protein EOP45_02890 [Sphingobacteriaceae bacterium]|nr:MAG: hypothetical protein EOP45_02890 [Sphingobacteriaceae bacterium]